MAFLSPENGMFSPLKAGISLRYFLLDTGRQCTDTGEASLVTLVTSNRLGIYEKCSQQKKKKLEIFQEPSPKCKIVVISTFADGSPVGGSANVLR